MISLPLWQSWSDPIELFEKVFILVKLMTNYYNLYARKTENVLELNRLLHVNLVKKIILSPRKKKKNRIIQSWSSWLTSTHFLHQWCIHASFVWSESINLINRSADQAHLWCLDHLVTLKINSRSPTPYYLVTNSSSVSWVLTHELS